MTNDRPRESGNLAADDQDQPGRIKDTSPSAEDNQLNPTNTVNQSGGVNFGIGNLIEQIGSIIGTQINIGRIEVPALPITALAVVVAAGIALLVYLQLARPQLTAPPAEPVLMTRPFNVAVASFGQIDSPEGQLRQSADGEQLAATAYEMFQARLPAELQPLVALQHDNIGFIPGSTAQERERAAATLAEQINAHVVIYGHLDTSKQPPRLVPEFYVSPLLRGAEESTGKQAFGAPVPLELPIVGNPINSQILEEDIIPRFEALTEFMWGLAFLRAEKIDRAIDRLQQAAEISAWRADEGKAILYLWLGTAFAERATNQKTLPLRECPLPVEAQPANNLLGSDGGCALQLYRQAAQLDASFARTYIGIGNLWLSHAKQERSIGTVIDCSAYQNALDAYQAALEPELAAIESAFLPLKAYYSIGLVYSTLYREANCFDQWQTDESLLYTSAIDNLSRGVEAYREQEDITLVRDIGARTYYQLGLVHIHAANYYSATLALSETIAITDPGELPEQRWQRIRWNAYNQLGRAYLGLENWEAAVAAYSAVVDRHEQGKYNDGIVVSDSYYHLGRAYESLDNLAQARESYQRAVDTIDPDPALVERASERLDQLRQP